MKRRLNSFISGACTRMFLVACRLKGNSRVLGHGLHVHAKALGLELPVDGRAGGLVGQGEEEIHVVRLEGILPALAQFAR